MNTTVDLVLASTYALPGDAGTGKSVENFLTFRISYETTNRLRKLFRRAPRQNVLYISGDSTFYIASHAVFYTRLSGGVGAEILDLIRPQVDTAVAAFQAIHSNGRISPQVMREAGRLWRLRVNDVLKFKKIGEYHVPSWDGINLTGDIAQATENGWIRTTKGNATNG